MPWIDNKIKLKL